MSNIDKRAQKELYAKVERQAHSLRGNTREYQVVTGLCPVNVIEMHAQKIQALLDELEAKDKRIAELEAREVVLPSVQDVHPLGPQSAKIFCEFHRSIVNRCADEIRKVGVKVSIKGN